MHVCLCVFPFGSILAGSFCNIWVDACICGLRIPILCFLCIHEYFPHMILGFVSPWSENHPSSKKDGLMDFMVNQREEKLVCHFFWFLSRGARKKLYDYCFLVNFPHRSSTIMVLLLRSFESWIFLSPSHWFK